MTPDYLAKLPAWLVALVQETEEAITFPIGVEIGGYASGLKAEIEVDHATILTPSPDRFRAASVYHEVLHIRRILVKGVPRLGVGDAVPPENFEAAERMATGEDNAMEHLVIVPTELDSYPERADYWTAKYREKLQFHAAEVHGEAAHNAFAITAWLFVRHVLPGAPIEAEVRQALEGRGLMQRAEEAFGLVIPRLADKPEVVRAWFQACGRDLHAVRLEYLDPRERRRRYRNF